MIKTLKTIALAMLATGATVSAANAKATAITYGATNVLQPVTISLTVYEQKAGATTPAIASGISFSTKNLIAAVSNALGTNATLDKHAELAILTTNGQIGTTNVVTNVPGSVPNTLVVSSNTLTLGAGTNLTIGNTSGEYYVTLVSTNGTNNVLVTTPGLNGPVVTTNSATNLTLDANQTIAIGSNTVTVETNLALGGVGQPVDTSALTVISNGTTVATDVLGTNTFSVSTNGSGVIAVTIGTNTTDYTNSATVTNVVLLGTNVVVTNGTAPGLGYSSSFTNSLTTTFEVNSTSNITVLTTTTDLAQGTVLKTNIEPLINTNITSMLVMADGSTNTPVPPNILSITEISTNDIVAENAADTSRTDWTIKGFILTTPTWSLNLQGLVHNTFDAFAVGKTHYAITNEAWTDVSGYGTNNAGAPVVVGGTIAVGSPASQKIPNP